MPALLLSILIPVFNGGKYLPHLLSMFSEAYKEMPQAFEGVEIIVANNASRDDTQIVAESFRDRLPILRPLSLLPHLPTAEENVFRSFEHCRGIFTWTLGVDDIPNFEHFPNIMTILKAQQHDFYLFNFAVCSEKMRISRNSIFLMEAKVFPINIVDLTQRFGFWFTIAGMSGQIVRTECVRNYDLASLVARTSKIYAHVTAYLGCFHDKRTAVINEPIVFYKVTHCDVDHWQKTAKSLGVFDQYFWTLGYILQLEYLENKGIIGKDYLRFMLETNEWNFFRPLLVIISKIAEQIRLMPNIAENRNRLTDEQYQHMRSFLLRADPFIREIIWKLDSIFEDAKNLKPSKKSDWGDFDILMREYQGDYLPSTMLISTHEEYEIFRVGKRYYAVHSQFREKLLERLRYIDNDEIAPFIFSGATSEEAIEKISHNKIEMPESDYQTAFRKESDNKISLLQRQLEHSRHQYEAIAYSTFWRLTFPLRQAIILLRHCFKRSA